MFDFNYLKYRKISVVIIFLSALFVGVIGVHAETANQLDPANREIASIARFLINLCFKPGADKQYIEALKSEEGPAEFLTANNVDEERVSTFIDDLNETVAPGSPDMTPALVLLADWCWDNEGATERVRVATGPRQSGNTQAQTDLQVIFIEFGFSEETIQYFLVQWELYIVHEETLIAFLEEYGLDAEQIDLWLAAYYNDDDLTAVMEEMGLDADTIDTINEQEQVLEDEFLADEGANFDEQDGVDENGEGDSDTSEDGENVDEDTTDETDASGDEENADDGSDDDGGDDSADDGGDDSQDDDGSDENVDDGDNDDGDDGGDDGGDDAGDDGGSDEE